MVLTLIGFVIRVLYLLLAHRPVGGALVWMASSAALYFAVLLLIGIFTPQNKITPGTIKCFDDWCVTVTGTTEYTTLSGTSPSAGRFVVVDVKVLAESKRVIQKGSNPHVYLIDATGQKFQPSAAAQSALERMAGPQPPLTNPVGPGDSFITRQAFDIPKGSGMLRVLVTEQPWITKIVLFNENSFFSGKTVFAIEPKLAST